MRKLITILSFLFCYVCSFSQTWPVTQPIYSPSTLASTQGGIKAAAFVVSGYADTTAVNTFSFIKFTPGAFVRTINDVLWFRNNAATAWVQVTSGAGGITVGTTPIFSGTNTRIPFNDNGIYNEDADLSWNKSLNTLNIASSGTGAINSGQLGFATGGNTRMIITSSGALSFGGGPGTLGQGLISSGSSSGPNWGTVVQGVNGTVNQIVISGTASAPQVGIAPTYSGQTSINTLGAVTAGTWNAATIGTAFGGTGQTSYSNGQLLIGKADGTLAKATLTAGTNITITNGDGTITISASGGGSGTDNSNVGTGFRLLVPSSQQIKTLFNGYAVGIDSASNANGLTFKADTSLLSTKLNVSAVLQSYVPNSRALTINGTTQDLSTDRTFTITTGGTSNRITVTNGATNPTIDIAATYVGQTSITTLGTITTGAWNGTAIGTAFGGTPIGGSTGQVLTKVSGTSYDYAWQTPSGGGGLAGGNLGAGYRLYAPASSGIKTLFAGTNISIDSTSNTNGITINADLQPFGEWVNQSFPGASLPTGWTKFTYAGSSVSSGLVLPANGGAVTNGYVYMNSQYSTSQNYVMITTFKLNAKPVAWTDGLLTGGRSANTSQQTQDAVIMRPVLPGTTQWRAHLNIYFGNTPTEVDSSTAINMSVDSMYRVYTTYSQTSVYVRVAQVNTVTGAEDLTGGISYKYPILATALLQPRNTGTVWLSFLGSAGQATVTNYSEYHYDLLNAPVGVFGNSIATRYDAPNVPSNWVRLAFAKSNVKYNLFAGGGNRFDEALLSLPEQVLYHPKYMLFELGVNDNVSSFRTTGVQYIDSLQVHGIIPIWIKLFNVVAKDTVAYNIAREQGIKLVDCWRSNFNIQANGLHPTALGNQTIAYILQGELADIIGQTGGNELPILPLFVGSNASTIEGGTDGRVFFQGTGGVLAQSSNLFWDNTNGRLGIRNPAPQTSLDIGAGSMRISGSTLPTSGEGLEMHYSGNAGFIYAYDRTAAAARNLTIGSNGVQAVFFANGTVGINMNSTPTTNLQVNGSFQSGIAGQTKGSVLLAGNTSGVISILPQAAAGTYNFNLPTTAGTAGYLLTSQGGSTSAMTWTDPSTFGISNTNLGTGYRLLTQNTQTVKTLFAGSNVVIDSTTNPNGLTISASSSSSLVPLGNIVNSTFPGPSIPTDWEDNAGSATISYSSGLNISGGNGTFTNNYSRSTFVSSGNNYKWNVNVTVNTKPANYSQGITIARFGNPGQAQMYLSLKYAGFSDSARLQLVVGSAELDSTSRIVLADGNNYNIYIAQSNNTVYFKVSLLSGGNPIVVKQKTFSIPLLYSTTVMPNQGKSGVLVLGGSYKVTTFQQYSNDLIGTDVLALGTSITQGYYANSFEDHYLSKAFEGTTKHYVNFGSASATLAFARLALPEIYLLQPKAVGIEHAVNDVCASIRTDAIPLIDSLQAHGIDVFWILDTNDPCKDTVVRNICNEQGIPLIYAFAGIATADFPDGTHPNSKGFMTMAKNCKAQAPQYFGTTGSIESYSIQSLRDVQLTNPAPTQGDLLTYNSTTKQWNNTAPTTSAYINNDGATLQTANFRISGNGSAARLGLGSTADATYPLYILQSTTNGAHIKLENGSISTLTQMGSGGFGITGWANALVIEGQGAGGIMLSGFGGSINFQTGSSRVYRGLIDNSGNFGIGLTTSISARIHAISTTEQLRLGFDASNYFHATVASTGSTTFDLIGTTPVLTISDSLTLTQIANNAIDTTNWKVLSIDGAGHVKKMGWAYAGGGGGSLTTTDDNLKIVSTVISTNTAVQALTDGATVTFTTASGINGRFVIGGNRTLAIPSPQDGKTYTVKVVQDGTGSRTLSLPGGTSAVLRTAANDSTILTGFYGNLGWNWYSDANGVLSITGTANQVIASSSTGNVTLSLPQNIHTGATPQFAGLGIGTAALSYIGVYVHPTVTGVAAPTGQWNDPILVPTSAGGNLYGALFQSHITEYSSGTHGALATVVIEAPIVTSGAATVANAYTLFVGGTPSVSGAINKALKVSGVTNLQGATEFSINNFASTTGSSTTLDDTNYTLTVDASTQAVTVNLPDATTCGGRVYNVKKMDSSGNSVTLDANGSQTIDGTTTKSTTTQYFNFQIQSNGTQWIIL